ncbi:MAG: hypothetical protein ACI9AD_001074 [Nitriliruptoraceae bacterium]|jgi:uncharacterized protein (TIGR03084 family)
MSILPQLLDDLTAEGNELELMVLELHETGWRTATPAAGWDVATTIGHLLWTDRVSAIAATDPDGFAAYIAEQMSGIGEDPVGALALEAGAMPSGDLLAAWQAARATLADALLAVPEGTKLPWFGPPMSPASMATARLMETWAHAQDVADALGITRVPTMRLKNVAHLAVRTRGFSYVMHGMEAPTTELRIELTAPDGSTWSWGPEDAAQRVTGSALDFCLLAVQRAHRADTDLVTTGADADGWLDVIQAFAGAPGAKRQPTGEVSA